MLHSYEQRTAIYAHTRAALVYNSDRAKPRKLCEITIYLQNSAHRRTYVSVSRAKGNECSHRNYLRLLPGTSYAVRISPRHSYTVLNGKGNS
jgi:hypothetical protein